MKKLTLTNGLLAIIAVCLSINTVIQLALFAAAKAVPPPPQEVVITGIALDDFNHNASEPLKKSLPIYDVKR